jgi:hypothetical protein
MTAMHGHALPGAGWRAYGRCGEGATSRYGQTASSASHPTLEARAASCGSHAKNQSAPANATQ